MLEGQNNHARTDVAAAVSMRGEATAPATGKQFEKQASRHAPLRNLLRNKVLPTCSRKSLRGMLVSNCRLQVGSTLLRSRSGLIGIHSSFPSRNILLHFAA
jgi:hypothetical protein